MVAPVGMYVRPLTVSAERWSASCHSWSGVRAWASQLRQNCVVVCTRASASSTSAGASSPSAHESAQYARSPAWSTWRARTPVALDPDVEVGAQPERDAGPGRVGDVTIVAHQAPLGGRAAVVEGRLADELHLDLALDALDGPHEDMLGVVVGGRARVRRDRVVVTTPAHGQRVAHDDPPALDLPRGDEHVRPRLVGTRDGDVAPVRS